MWAAKELNMNNGSNKTKKTLKKNKEKKKLIMLIDFEFGNSLMRVQKHNDKLVKA